MDLDVPDKCDMSYLQAYLETDEMGPLALSGRDALTWGSKSEPHTRCPDLVTLRPRYHEDMFSTWVTDTVIGWIFKHRLHRFRKPSPVHGHVAFQDGPLLRITSLVANLLASLLAICTIVVLYLVKRMAVKLALIVVFHLVLSLCLATFTNAKRAEIFAISAA